MPVQLFFPARIRLSSPEVELSEEKTLCFLSYGSEEGGWDTSSNSKATLSADKNNVVFPVRLLGGGEPDF